ncbi:DUF4870 family protein [Novosphingobium sp. M1R2S20]|uniref:DUF4870 family protein n=1 Tax=Novosphingobium rhizovicinum TaxID=3228928 RepID=A0ABV3R979_9SPHN
MEQHREDSADGAPQGSRAQSFELNRPTIISLLYLASCVVGITAIIGVILAYIWRNEPQDAWEGSHFEYLINTFWIGFVGAIISTILILVLIGLPLLLAVLVLVLVRSVMSLLNAQKHAAMPNPSTLLV